MISGAVRSRGVVIFVVSIVGRVDGRQYLSSLGGARGGHDDGGVAGEGDDVGDGFGEGALGLRVWVEVEASSGARQAAATGRPARSHKWVPR